MISSINILPDNFSLNLAPQAADVTKNGSRLDILSHIEREHPQ
jgi:hypothetical protein